MKIYGREFDETEVQYTDRGTTIALKYKGQVVGFMHPDQYKKFKEEKINEKID